jgi:hypothetical protein
MVTTLPLANSRTAISNLVRDVENLTKEFPEQAETQTFAATLIPLSAAAMHLHSQPLPDAAHYDPAREIRQEIEKVTEHTAKHLGVRKMQDLLCENASQLYHWVEDRRMPADNNHAERQLRPTVIARTTSFRSQSNAGAETREVLMTQLHTLALRVADPEGNFKAVFDQLAEVQARDPNRLLFPLDSSETCLRRTAESLTNYLARQLYDAAAVVCSFLTHLPRLRLRYYELG